MSVIKLFVNVFPTDISGSVDFNDNFVHFCTIMFICKLIETKKRKIGSNIDKLCDILKYYKQNNTCKSNSDYIKYGFTWNILILFTNIQIGF